MAITVKDLKEKIQFLDDNMLIGGSGHFGELLEVYDIEVRTVSKKRFSNENDTETILCISMESAGDEPD